MKKYIIVPPRRKNKKYSVMRWNKDKKKYEYLLSFGDVNFQHFMDKTPLNLYEYLNHYDYVRRYRYYLRHGFTDNKESAKYWSNKFLW